MKRIGLLAMIVAGVFLFGTKAVYGAAADPGCAALGGNDAGLGTTCTLSGVHNVSGTFTLGETLHMLNPSSIITGGADITIHITAGDFLMDANALINASLASGTGGDITVTLDAGDVDLAPGSIIRSNGQSGGAIAITTSNTHTIDIDGLVESVGTIGGQSPNQPPGGGTITIVAGCELTVSDAGKISSRGADPGADLVHVEGCTVVIDGIVESVGPGHANPHPIANHCNLDPAAHPLGGASFFTACVEVWGNTVTINSTGTHKGEVRTDPPGVRAAGRSWIDIFSRGDITIVNDTTGPYSVHANSQLSGNNSNSFGGLVTVKSALGNFTSSGLAIQANGIGLGSDGGDVIVQASGDVVFGTSSIQAIGGTGSNRQGGHIQALAFNGQITGSLPGELNAGTAGLPLIGGSVELRACAADPTLTYGGAITATTITEVQDGALCGNNPTFPVVPQWYTLVTATQFIANAATCDARCGQLCSKSGRKFLDLGTGGIFGIDDPAYPGIQGLQIHMFNQPGTPAFHDHQLTGANGEYAFLNVPPGDYFVCEQGGPPTQTFPAADQTSGACATHVGIAGSRGYAVTLQPVEGVCADTGNDFGNTRAQCPEDPKAVLTKSVGNPASGVTNFSTVQAAYDAAVNGDVIGLFSNTTENLLLGGAKTLKITQCTLARVTAADSTKPVWEISSTGKLTIVGPDSVGGTIGWLIDNPSGGPHTLKSVRANGASIWGIRINSNGNQVSWNDVSGNGGPGGILVAGNSNILKGGTVGPNNADGVKITGNSNSLSGATVQSNTGNGVIVSGSSNQIKSNKANSNTLDGFRNAAGASNSYSGNSSNTGGKENGGAEYAFVTAGSDGGSNRADGTNVPSAGKCPDFAQAGTVCE